MRDISARELKGHNILAVGAFSGQHPLDGGVCGPQAPHPLRQPRRRGPTVSHRGRLPAGSGRQRSQQIKIKRHAHVVEGHIIDFKPKKKRRHP